MRNVFNWIFIFLLLAASSAAAFFMVLESGSFYQTLYQSQSRYYGYWAAALNEIFMAVMAAVWITRNDNKKSHIINYFFKFLLIILFVTTIGGASYFVAAPILSELQTQSNNAALVKIIDSQIQYDQKSLDIFANQNQKTNSAIAAKRAWNNHQEVKSMIQNSKHMFPLYIQLVIILLLRLGIQSSNLGCVWLAGWLYRNSINFQQNNDINSFKESVGLMKNNIAPVAPKKVITKKSLRQSSMTSEQPKHQESSKIKLHSVKKSKSISGKAGVNIEKEVKKRKVEQQTKSKQSIRKDNTKHVEIQFLREQITDFLNRRNEGILIRDVANAIGITEKSLVDIQNFKIPNNQFDPKFLQKILDKFLFFIDQEAASSF